MELSVRSQSRDRYCVIWRSAAARLTFMQIASNGHRLPCWIRTPVPYRSGGTSDKAQISSVERRSLDADQHVEFPDLRLLDLFDG